MSGVHKLLCAALITLLLMKIITGNCKFVKQHTHDSKDQTITIQQHQCNSFAWSMRSIILSINSIMRQRPLINSLRRPKTQRVSLEDPACAQRAKPRQRQPYPARVVAESTIPLQPRVMPQSTPRTGRGVRPHPQNAILNAPTPRKAKSESTPHHIASAR